MKGREDTGTDMGLWKGPTPTMKAAMDPERSELTDKIDMMWFCIEWREMGGWYVVQRRTCGCNVEVGLRTPVLCCLHVDVRYYSIICRRDDPSSLQWASLLS